MQNEQTLPAFQPEVAIQPESEDGPQERLWTRSEYYKLAEAGFFENERVELMGGRIVTMAAMNSYHRRGVIKVDRMLQRVFTEGFHVSVQCPLSIGEDSDPEPDVAVIAGSEDDFIDAHPTTAVLVVEISESTLKYDQTEKASLYARASVPDYWIVNLKNRRLEVHRRPMEDTTQPHGFGYAELYLFTEREFVSPLAMPDARIAVSDLLPPTVE
jgi:Uma2 family endonuclease